MLETWNALTLSNAHHFREIANAAFLKWEALGKDCLRPNPVNPRGRIIAYPLVSEMSKEGLICIVFFGVYLEALFVIKGRRKFGKNKWDAYFDKLIYEAKLELLGCENERILSKCKRFRIARNDVIHERPVPLGDFKKCKRLSEEVINAQELIRLIENHFEIKQPVV
jgi:hypothetical protein